MDTIKKLDAEGSLGFLVSDIARLLREQFNEAAQSVGLTLAQARTLLHLARNEGISQVSLAQILEVQPITLLRQIDKLEQAGLVERRANPSDRRAQQLFLKPAVEPLLESITTLGRVLTDRAFAGFTDDRRALALSLLREVKENLTTPAADRSAGRARV
jgi:MarR family transcriptional regulator for hemolysin